MRMRSVLAVAAALGLMLGTASAARAQGLADYDYTNLGFRGFGFEYGYTWPSKVRPTSTYNLSLDLGFLGPGVRITPEITYWSSTLKGSELQRLATQLDKLPALESRGVVITADELGPIRWSDVGINLGADFLWNTPLGVQPYVGALIGVHALNGSGAAINNTFVEDLLDSIVPAVGAMAGIQFAPLPRLHVFGEARYSLLTDIRYPELRLGATLLLPGRETTGGGGGK